MLSNRSTSPRLRGRRAKRPLRRAFPRRKLQGGTTSSALRSEVIPQSSSSKISSPWLDDDFSDHSRMDRAEIFVFPWRGKGLRELVIGIERRRFEFPVLLVYRMRAVVIIGPSNCGSGSDNQRRWGKVEIVDFHSSYTCCGRDDRLTCSGALCRCSKEKRNHSRGTEQCRSGRIHRWSP